MIGTRGGIHDILFCFPSPLWRALEPSRQIACSFCLEAWRQYPIEMAGEGSGLQRRQRRKRNDMY